MLKTPLLVAFCLASIPAIVEACPLGRNCGRAARVPNCSQPAVMNCSQPAYYQSGPIMAPPMIQAPIMQAPVMQAPIMQGPIINSPPINTIPAPTYQNYGPTIAPLSGCEPTLQPQVSFQPVTRTEIRREAQTVTVPVVTQRQVTVDEGGYQQVWVPKMVSKNISETTMQQQVQYRDVPYQYTEHVPVTRMVATPSVPCHGCAPGMVTGYQAPIIGGAINLSPIYAQQGVPVISAQPVPAITDVAQQQNWTKVEPKPEAQPTIQQQSHQEVAPAAAGRFSPVPSAVNAWRAQSSFAQ